MKEHRSVAVLFFSCSRSKRKQFDFEQCRRKKLRWSISWWSKFNTLLSAVLISALFILVFRPLHTQNEFLAILFFVHISPMEWNFLVYAIAIMDNFFFTFVRIKYKNHHFACTWLLVYCTFSIYSFVCWAHFLLYYFIALASQIEHFSQKLLIHNTRFARQ